MILRTTVAALALVACFREEPTGPLEGAECADRAWMGSFLGDATGAVTTPVAGCAYFTIQDTPPRGAGGVTKTFVMVLSNGPMGGFSQTIGLFRWGGRLGPGTYQVNTPDVGGVYGQILVAQGNRTFLITSGTVTVEESLGDMRGSADLTATESGSGATITITGRFFARCVDQFYDHWDEKPPTTSRVGPCSIGGGA